MLLNRNYLFDVLKEGILCKVLFKNKEGEERLGAEAMLSVSTFKYVMSIKANNNQLQLN